MADSEAVMFETFHNTHCPVTISELWRQFPQLTAFRFTSNRVSLCVVCVGGVATESVGVMFEAFHNTHCPVTNSEL